MIAKVNSHESSLIYFTVTLFLIFVLFFSTRILIEQDSRSDIFGQTNQTEVIETRPLQLEDQMQKPIKHLETNNTEQFTFSYNVSNFDRRNPINHTLRAPLGDNWMLTIQNNMSYAQRSDAKTIVRLYEPHPSEKFIEIAMFGGNSEAFWIAVNSEQSGYIKVYERSDAGWSPNEPITIGHGNNQGLSVNNGLRIILDRLSLEGFNLGSVSIYGKDQSFSPLNTYSGMISFDIFYGNPSRSPVYYVPLIMLVGIGVVLVLLLQFKKRKEPSGLEPDRKLKDK